MAGLDHRTSIRPFLYWSGSFCTANSNKPTSLPSGCRFNVQASKREFGMYTVSNSNRRAVEDIARCVAERLRPLADFRGREDSDSRMSKSQIERKACLRRISLSACQINVSILPDQPTIRRVDREQCACALMSPSESLVKSCDKLSGNPYSGLSSRSLNEFSDSSSV
ncbi:hypothetical protein K461DRAFT_161476 [Myriangium duriaei CBS 260.36]|uniref:Uncharacterized protein n=1 Tax=Myriangium duriaei CBS 260.36 TaxID=1168546 RepID=A0A9P4J456_9PEZI|nr:hypothetical protein K461DRAFT_161476 [Myriangium duriaei CBS 260.36]